MSDYRQIELRGVDGYVATQRSISDYIAVSRHQYGTQPNIRVGTESASLTLTAESWRRVLPVVQSFIEDEL